MTLIEDLIDVAVASGPDPRSAVDLIEPPALDPFHPPVAFTPIADTVARAQVAVSGTVTSCEVCAWAGGSTLEVTLDDPTGSLVLAFLGRRNVAGIRVGCHLMAGGRVVLHQNRRSLLNPYYWLVADRSGQS